jgi:hypothetical protein
MLSVVSAPVLSESFSLLMAFSLLSGPDDLMFREDDTSSGLTEQLSLVASVDWFETDDATRARLFTSSGSCPMLSVVSAPELSQSSSVLIGRDDVIVREDDAVSGMTERLFIEATPVDWFETDATREWLFNSSGTCTVLSVASALELSQSSSVLIGLDAVMDCEDATASALTESMFSETATVKTRAWLFTSSGDCTALSAALASDLSESPSFLMTLLVALAFAGVVDLAKKLDTVAGLGIARMAAASRNCNNVIWRVTA